MKREVLEVDDYINDECQSKRSKTCLNDDQLWKAFQLRQVNVLWSKTMMLRETVETVLSELQECWATFQSSSSSGPRDAYVGHALEESHRDLVFVSRILADKLVIQ
eukprot:GILJ01031904.1.p2 GENE.GILJ01031904.1~~GILJ01031904.1.p2  ORF type:complete len:106 (-),score=12.62 GILJ01031904.1:330-647(-)